MRRNTKFGRISDANLDLTRERSIRAPAIARSYRHQRAARRLLDRARSLIRNPHVPRRRYLVGDHGLLTGTFSPYYPFGRRRRISWRDRAPAWRSRYLALSMQQGLAPGPAARSVAAPVFSSEQSLAEDGVARPVAAPDDFPEHHAALSAAPDPPAADGYPNVCQCLGRVPPVPWTDLATSDDPASGTQPEAAVGYSPGSRYARDGAAR